MIQSIQVAKKKKKTKVKSSQIKLNKFPLFKKKKKSVCDTFTDYKSYFWPPPHTQEGFTKAKQSGI